MYYDFENRLQQDAEKAAKETENIGKVLTGIRNSSIGSVITIIRLVSFLLPIAALLLPIFKIGSENITLISILKWIISAPSLSVSIFGNTAFVLCFVTFGAVIVCAFVSLVNSLFSFTKNGFKRNVIISALGIIIFAGLYIAVIAAGGSIAYGFFLVLVLQILTVALHFAVNNKMNAQ